MKACLHIKNRIALAGLLLGLLASLLSTETWAQAPVELASVTSTTNGVQVAWTDPVPGNAYTVQVRDSLTSGVWKNGTTRYRWPWPFAHWGDAPRTLPGARFYRVLAQPAATPNRGKLLSSYLRGTNSTNALNGQFLLTGYGRWQGAGGIGGLLARTAHSGSDGVTYYRAFYHADRGGNITCLINENNLPELLTGTIRLEEQSERRLAWRPQIHTDSLQRSGFQSSDSITMDCDSMKPQRKDG